MEHKAGLDGAVDDITALGAMGKKNRENDLVCGDIDVQGAAPPLLWKCFYSLRLPKKKRKGKKKNKKKRRSQEANASTFVDFWSRACKVLKKKKKKKKGNRISA